MKKITLLVALLISSIGFSQQPSTAAPTPPARDAADVVSIFSQTTDETTTIYNDISADLNPFWESTSGQVTFPAIDNDRVMQIPSFNYQGIDFDSNRQNLSNFDKMHFDVWTNGATVRMSLIWDGGESFAAGSAASANPNTWTSIDVDLADFPNADLTTIRQLKLDTGDGTQTIYVDNIYFYKVEVDPNTDATLSDLRVDGTTITGFASSKEVYGVEIPQGNATPVVSATATQNGASVQITQANGVPGNATVMVTAQDNTTTKTYTVSFEVEPAPQSAAPTPPSFAANNVVSLYSESYTPATSLNNVPWDDSVFEEVTIAGSKVLKISGVNFLGIDLDDYLNATSMTHLHMDYWIAEDWEAGMVLNPKLSNHAAQSGETSAIDISNPIGSQAEVKNWQSKDFALNGDRGSIKQFLITQANFAEVFYLDNLYMYIEGTASVEDELLASVSLYPNPAENTLKISAKETIQNAVIYNVIGKKVKSISINDTSKEIDITDLNAGIYLIKYTINNSVGTSKFIKK